MKLRTPADFGALVRDRRRKNGLNQQELARKAGVGRQWLVELEKGKPSAPLALVLRTLDALGIVLTPDAGGGVTKRSNRARGSKPVDINGVLDALRSGKPNSQPKKRKKQ
jgi:HTH-type transcriptional regulator / antitoxin HipB